ncbi:conserved hypothetical protein [Altererythrobacter sp. B11]|uniref:hypothetical protein n=1 Tax=Altererythrobacter sp. B11 TaxID=2060312 RepID=UPI000DC728D0|nr:hypothetical protein [Altererythrobacter sp. B11]BBC72775.1 conserved hypothetical protein [Altererythrobacter sp. B11]
MTRALHEETEVQRAENPDVVPAEVRERGYEPTDAPPAKVAAGLGGFLALMLAGLGAAATLTALTSRNGRLEERAVPPPVFPDASKPPLLVDPVAHRRAIEAQARAHLRRADMEAATRAVEREGEVRP